MLRPCFLVIDNEYPGSISTRKLVIETAKFNVITAYDATEGLQSLERFPNVDGVVLNASIAGISCEQLIQRLRSVKPEIPVIVTSAGGHSHCPGEYHHVDSYDPKKLLDVLQKLKPEQTRQTAERDARLED